MSEDNKETVLYHKIDKTLYEISVKQAEDAQESAEDILLRIIVDDLISDTKEDSDG